MATGITIAGRGSLRINGVIYNCSSIKATLGSETREKIVGMRGPAGDKITAVAPTLEATIIVTPDTSITALDAAENVTASVQFADGRSAVFEGASTKSPLTLSAEDGTADITMDAMSSVEILG